MVKNESTESLHDFPIIPLVSLTVEGRFMATQIVSPNYSSRHARHSATENKVK